LGPVIENFEFWTVAGSAGTALLVLGAVAFGLRRRSKAADAMIARLESQLSSLKETYGAAPVAGFTVSSDKHADGAELLGRPGMALCEAFELPEGKDTSLEGLCEFFIPDDAEALRGAVEQLGRVGGDFSLHIMTLDRSRRFDVSACRTDQAAGLQGTVIWFSDVTALADALDLAEMSHDRLRMVVDALPFPIWRRGADLALTDCNSAYADALEETREAVLTDGLELLGRSQSRQARAIAKEALAGDEPARRESHVVIGEARRLMEINEWKLPDGGLVGLALDRTDREELQSELKRQIGAQAEMLENLGTATAIFGTDLRLDFYNTAYVRLWDIEERFFQNRPHLGDVLEVLREHRMLPEQPDFPAYKKTVIRTFGTLIESREELIHLPDGMTLRLLAVPNPLGGVLLSYEDVTDRLAMERNYNTMIAVQRETLDNLYEAVVVYGADGVLRLFNPAFIKIWNFPAEILKNQPHVRDLLEHSRGYFSVSDANWPDYLERAVATTTEPLEKQGRLERADSSVVEWARVPLPDGAVLYTFIDVTDSFRVERALRERNEALETADRLKSEFIANISYELRTPLNAIIGFAEILTNQFFGKLNTRQMEYSQAIVESSQHLTALINDILDLASIEAGYLEIDRVPVDLQDLLASVYKLGRERAHNRELELTLDCPSDIGQINADPRRLKQALFNLLSNALKFTPEGGRITIAARRSEDAVVLSIEDTGIGIAEDDKERVFNRFERGDGQSRNAGAGLGLSLVRSLVELHGGQVELHSVPSGGTKVDCHLPLRAEPELKTIAV
jgi:signal transduction histidine kinase